MKQIHPRIPQDVYVLLDSLCAGGVSVSEAVATAVSAYALDMARSMMDQGNTTVSPELMDAAKANLAAKSWAHMGHTPPPWVSVARIKADLPALTQPDSWANMLTYDPLLAMALHQAAMAVDDAAAAVAVQ